VRPEGGYRCASMCLRMYVCMQGRVCVSVCVCACVCMCVCVSENCTGQGRLHSTTLQTEALQICQTTLCSPTTHTHTHTNTHTHTYSLSHTSTHIHTSRITNTHMHSYTLKPSCTRAQAHTLAYIRAHTRHTRTHKTHTHAHIRTYRRALAEGDARAKAEEAELAMLTAAGAQSKGSDAFEELKRMAARASVANPPKVCMYVCVCAHACMCAFLTTQRKLMLSAECDSFTLKGATC